MCQPVGAHFYLFLRVLKDLGYYGIFKCWEISGKEFFSNFLAFLLLKQELEMTCSYIM